MGESCAVNGSNCAGLDKASDIVDHILQFRRGIDDYLEQKNRKETSKKRHFLSGFEKAAYSILHRSFQHFSILELEKKQDVQKCDGKYRSPLLGEHATLFENLSYHF